MYYTLDILTLSAARCPGGVSPLQKGRVSIARDRAVPRKGIDSMKDKRPHRDNFPGTLSPVDVPISQLPVVDLSTEHLRRASELAVDRNESYHAIDGGTVYGENSALTSHETGILGEMAVAELYATSIDTETYAFGDGGVDLDLWGVTGDVKSTTTTKMTYPQLLVRANKDLAADIYLQTHIQNWGEDGAQVRILGYATRAQLADKTGVEHPGETKNYVVEPSELTLPPLVQVCHG